MMQRCKHKAWCSRPHGPSIIGLRGPVCNLHMYELASRVEIDQNHLGIVLMLPVLHPTCYAGCPVMMQAAPLLLMHSGMPGSTACKQHLVHI